MNKWIFVFLIGATSAFGQGYVQNTVQATYEGTFDQRQHQTKYYHFSTLQELPYPEERVTKAS